MTRAEELRLADNYDRLAVIHRAQGDPSHRAKRCEVEAHFARTGERMTVHGELLYRVPLRPNGTYTG